MFSEGRMTGLAVGICVGLIIVVLIMRLINKDNSFKTDYDERQERIRGLGYKYAFYAMAITLGVLCVISSGMTIPVVPIVLFFIPIFVGAVVQVCYCIWEGAYIGQNTNIPRFVIIMVVISVFNLFVGFMTWKEGNMIVGGQLQAPFANLLCGVLFGIIGLVALARKLADREVE